MLLLREDYWMPAKLEEIAFHVLPKLSLRAPIYLFPSFSLKWAIILHLIKRDQLAQGATEAAFLFVSPPLTLTVLSPFMMSYKSMMEQLA